MGRPEMREPPHLREQAGGATNTQPGSVDMPINTTSGPGIPNSRPATVSRN